MTTGTSDKTHILDLTLDELSARCEAGSVPNYRAKQILEWVYQKRCTEFALMTNLSKADREAFSATYTILSSKVLAQQESRDGTKKLLLEFEPGKHIETVLIPAKEHLTACISTQFGCPARCMFCATGQTPFEGNLTAGQIVEQVLLLQRIADESKKRVSHVVAMGMGEPLLNYVNVIKAIRIINSPYSLHIAARHITISTVGLPDAIRRLAHEGLQVTLAISLHSPDQQVRERLMPIARQHKLDQIVDAAKYYFQVTGREVTLEYVLIGGVNTSADDARNLSTIAKAVRANVNLIEYNPSGDTGFTSPSRAEIDTFASQLRQRHINVHLRKSKGQDIEAACGQLRKRYGVSAST